MVWQSSRERKSISPVPRETTTTKIFNQRKRRFQNFRGTMFPSCRITSSSAGVSQDRSSAAEGGRSKFRLAFLDLLPRGLWSSEPLEVLSFSLSFHLLSSLLGLMRRSWHLTDRLPLWQLVWNIYGKLWIMGMEISRERYENFLIGDAWSRKLLWSWKFVQIIFFLDGV